MNKSNAALFLGCLLLAAGCSTVQVRYDYYPKADFSQYRTFSFLPLPDTARANELLVERVKDAVGAGLAAKGFKQTADNPDLQIAIHTSRREKYDLANWGYSYFPFNFYWRPFNYWGGPWGIDIYSYDEGRIVLDIVDARQKKLVWRAAAEEDLPAIQSPATMQVFVSRAVDKMLSHFPPK